MVMLPSIRRKYMVSRIPRGATVPVSDCVVALATDKAVYTGSARTVGVSVSWGGTALVVNEDYTLSFANNVNIGPATVTVTGMGQFSGSVTKTFFGVSASDAGWDFNIEDAQSVGTVSVSMASFVLPLMDNYQSGQGFVPVPRWSNGNWLSGYVQQRDTNGEFHVSDMDFSSYVTNDSTGADGYTHGMAVSQDGRRTYWASNDSSPYIKQKYGAAFDFGGMSYDGVSPDLSGVLENTQIHNNRMFFANGGRYLFIPQKQMRVCRLTLATPYDVTTIDVDSALTALAVNIQTNIVVSSLLFWNSGYSALVSANNGTMYQISAASPYDFTGSTVVGQKVSMGEARSLCIVNGGKTLLAGTTTGIKEFLLTAQEES